MTDLTDVIANVWVSGHDRVGKVAASKIEEALIEAGFTFTYTPPAPAPAPSAADVLRSNFAHSDSNLGSMRTQQLRAVGLKPDGTPLGQ
jgi:hypothetical protein